MTTRKHNPFDVMKWLSEQDGALIKGFGMENVTRARLVQNGRSGEITMLVDPPTASTIMLQRPLHFMLVVVSKEAWERAMQELDKLEERKKEEAKESDE